MMRDGAKQAVFGGSAFDGTLEVLGFEGRGEAGPRTVDRKRKAKDRRRAKIAKASRHRNRAG